MIKILTMLVGELDYSDLFQDNPDDNMTTNKTESGNSEKMGTRYKFAGHVWYLGFLVFVTLVLMNLLVGLAVSDIQVNIHGIQFITRIIKLLD